MTNEYDLIVIGAGPGGYVAALRASKLGLKTAIIEKENNLGGTCLNVGCIPSKTLLYYSEQLFENQKHRPQKGLEFEGLKMNFPRLMKTKEGVVKGLNMGVAGLLKRGKVNHFFGLATFKNSKEIEVDSSKGKERLSAKHILIATGSEPIELPGLEFDEKTIISSTGALALEKVPKKMIVIGAGVIGLELGSVYNRLGAEVEFVEALDHIGGNLQPEVSQTLEKILAKQGLKFHLSHRYKSAKKEGGQVTLEIENSKKEKVNLSAEVVLVSVGRKPYTEGLGLEQVGIALDDRGKIKVNGFFQTSQPSIYAIGDVIDGPMLAHKASEEGVAVVEQIAEKNPQVHYLAIPNVIYTQPEVATVGFTTQEAKALGLTPKVGKFPFLGNSRAHCVDAKEGLALVVADEKTDAVIGMHIVSEHAGEMIALGALAIKKHVTAKELGALCFPHPTFSEAIKEAALDVHKEAIHF